MCKHHQSLLQGRHYTYMLAEATNSAYELTKLRYAAPRMRMEATGSLYVPLRAVVSS